MKMFHIIILLFSYTFVGYAQMGTEKEKEVPIFEAFSKNSLATKHLVYEFPKKTYWGVVERKGYEIETTIHLGPMKFRFKESMVFVLSMIGISIVIFLGLIIALKGLRRK